MSRSLSLYPIAVAALLILLPLLEPRTGLLTLANIFSIHLALAALVLVPIALVARSRGLAAAIGVLGLVACLRFGGDWVSVPPPKAGSDHLLTTASWNLELGSRGGADAVEAITRMDLDVIALQELGQEHARAIEASDAVKARYPFRELYPHPGVLGMGLLSKVPIATSEYVQDPATVEAIIDVDGTELTIINAHPLAGRLDMAGPIPVGFDSNDRDERLRWIRTRVEEAIARSGSVIILGDFNVTPVEPGFRELTAGLHDAHAEVGQGPGWTWRPSRLEWMGLGVIRIDHALSSPRIPPVSVTEHCGLAGDHCILEAWFSLANARHRFDVEFPAVGERGPLPVAIDDRTGLLISVEPEVGGQPHPAIRHPDRPDTLLISWTGGVCDRVADVSVIAVGAGFQIAIRTEVTCSLLAGVERTLSMRFATPIDPSRVSVEATAGGS